jgi:hypothetical protein
VIYFIETELPGGVAVTTGSSFPLAPFQQFILDCADLASSLDSLNTQGLRSYLLAALFSGKTQYRALLLRREALSPSVVEAAWVDFMLEGLLARLRFLESHVRISA